MPLTRKEMEAFAERLEKNFNYPFLPDGTVKVHVYDDHFNLRIGRRDVDFNLKLDDIGAGTMMTENPFPRYDKKGKIKKDQKFMRPKKKSSKGSKKK